MRKLRTYQQGDPWRGTEQPLIRFGGRWLREAGFEPGDCYQLAVHAPGCLALTRAIQNDAEEEE